MCVEPGVVLFCKLDTPALSGGIGIEQVLQSNPDVDAAASLAVPCFDQGFIHIQSIEIVVFRMLTDIGYGDQPIADRLGYLDAALHESPHVNHGRGARDHRLSI